MESQASKRAGFTLVELLVTIAVVSVLMTLLVPAAQSAREAARAAGCRNNLKQIGIAVGLHEANHSYLPSSGNNGTISQSGSPAPFQQAGMFYQILPFLQQAPGADVDAAVVRSMAIPQYYCPTRRPPIKRDDGFGNQIGLNDYAMPLWKDSSAGAGFGGSSPACWNIWNDTTGDLVNHPYYRNTVFVRSGKGNVAFSPGRLSDITDGTSNVLMVAEKFMDPTRYSPTSIPSDPAQGAWPTLSFTDNGYFGGWGWATVRCSMYGPIRDQPYGSIAYWQMFGSAHPAGINAVFADGSVHTLSFQIVNSIFQKLCRKNDGADIGPDSY